jgi:hypothetical protein
MPFLPCRESDEVAGDDRSAAMMTSSKLAPIQRLGVVLGAASLFCGSSAFWQVLVH